MLMILDIGTTSMRTILFDEKGEDSAKFARTCGLLHPSPEAVESDMAVFEGNLTSLFEETGAFIRKNHIAIEGIGITSQRSSVIPVDRNGHALKNAIMWQDTRAGNICKRYANEYEDIYGVAGMRPSPVFSAPKMVFLKETDKRTYDKAFKLVGFMEYALKFMTGEFATDKSIASRTCLFDVAGGAWSEKLIRMFNLDISKLCPLIEVGGEAGTIRPNLAEILGIKKDTRVFSCGGDQQCAAIGIGGFEESIVANIGSGAYVLATSPSPCFSYTTGTNCNASAIPGYWVCEGTVISACKTQDWVNDMFFSGNGDYSQFSEALKKAGRGASGVRLAVNFAGSGTPYWVPGDRGALFGLSTATEKKDIAMATIEGIAVETARCIENVKLASASASSEIRISGGLSKDETFKQVLADASQMVVAASETKEATARGAFLSVSTGLGAFSSIKDAYFSLYGGDTGRRYLPNRDLADLYKKIEIETSDFYRKK